MATAAVALTLPPTAFAQISASSDGFNHPRKMYDLTAALIHRGYSDANIQAVLGGNFRRLLGSTWTQAQNKTGEKS
jgi:microsomal dipeptidase-like Zn-dependent dipeptidase